MIKLNDCLVLKYLKITVCSFNKQLIFRHFNETTSFQCPALSVNVIILLFEFHGYAGVTVYLDPLGSLTPGGQDTPGYLDPRPGYLDPQVAKYPLSGILPADTLIRVY